MNYRKVFRYYYGGFFSSLVLMVLAIMINVSWLGFVGAAVCVASLFLALACYKCPFCGHNLNIRQTTIPKYCPECGHYLAEPGEEEPKP